MNSNREIGLCLHQWENYQNERNQFFGFKRVNIHISKEGITG